MESLNFSLDLFLPACQYIYKKKKVIYRSVTLNVDFFLIKDNVAKKEKELIGLLILIINSFCLYGAISFENKKGIVATIFKNPIKTLLLLLLSLIVVSILVQVAVSSTKLNEEEIKTLVKYCVSICYIVFVLSLMLLISKFAKTRVVNEDKSVSIKNKKSYIIRFFALFFLYLNLNIISYFVETGDSKTVKNFQKAQKEYEENKKD